MQGRLYISRIIYIEYIESTPYWILEIHLLGRKGQVDNPPSTIRRCRAVTETYYRYVI